MPDPKDKFVISDSTLQSGMISIDPLPGDLVIIARGTREVLRFKPDGRIEVGAGLTPDQAAREFLDAIPAARAERIEKLEGALSRLVNEWERFTLMEKNELLATLQAARAALKESYIGGYCERSNLTREQFDQHGVARPCNCGEPGCRGWEYVTRDGNVDT